MPIREYLRRIFDFLKSKLLQLNLFYTGVPNETILQNERRSTRLYLVLLITSMAIIITYYSIISYTKIIVIESPSLTEYSNIIEETSLQCPCSNIAVKYELFATIEPNYHELCESDFISDEWINHLFRLYEHSWNKSISTDFRRIAVFQFQTLRSFCQLVKDTINNDLQSFNYTDFVESHVVFPKNFQAQIDSFIKEFIDGTSKTFLRILHCLQDTTAQSLFMTGASITSVRPVTQFRLTLDQGIVPYPGINYTFKDGSSCVCSSSTATPCMGLATFDNNIVSGFQTGCYMLSALMNSTLEVLYNQTFINMLSNSSKNFKKLESFNSNWKIEMLLSQMFVKSWSNRTSYDKYFQSCAPESCSYRKIQRYSFWSILLLLIGLFGGLSSVLKILTPILILKIWPIIWKIICRRQSRATQIVAVEVMPGNPY